MDSVEKNETVYKYSQKDNFLLNIVLGELMISITLPSN